MKKRQMVTTGSMNLGTEENPIMVPQVQIHGRVRKGEDDYSVLDELMAIGPRGGVGPLMACSDHLGGFPGMAGAGFRSA